MKVKRRDGKQDLSPARPAYAVPGVLDFITEQLCTRFPQLLSHGIGSATIAFKTAALLISKKSRQINNIIIIIIIVHKCRKERREIYFYYYKALSFASFLFFVIILIIIITIIYYQHPPLFLCLNWGSSVNKDCPLRKSFKGFFLQYDVVNVLYVAQGGIKKKVGSKK